MAVALYGVMLVQPGNVGAVKRYLYDHTEIVEVTNVRRYGDGGPDLSFLVLRTEADTEERAQFLQQYQADRLASGMHGMTIGFETRLRAEEHARERATANDWGLTEWYPATALVPEV